MARAAAAPVEPDEDEFEEELEDDELEELEEPEVPAPAKKTKTKTAVKQTVPKKVAEAPAFGAAQLAAHVTEVTGETYDGRGVRMLLRKLAADGKLDRAVGETRERYSFSGPKDPIVVAVVTMVQDGTAKALKQDGLDKVKALGEKKKAEKKAAREAAEAAAAEGVEDDDDAEEMEEVEETPAPKRRAAKTAAPAKATPATRKRTATK